MKKRSPTPGDKPGPTGSERTRAANLKKDLEQAEKLARVREACARLVEQGHEPTYQLVGHETGIPHRSLERNPYREVIRLHGSTDHRSAPSGSTDGRLKVLEDQVKYLQELLKRERTKSSHLMTLLAIKGVRYEDRG